MKEEKVKRAENPWSGFPALKTTTRGVASANWKSIALPRTYHREV
jgi:hypothetical protein